MTTRSTIDPVSKKPNRSRDRQLNLRVSDAEYEWFVARADGCHMSLSDWIRQSLLWCCDRARTRPMPVDDE